MLWSIQGKHYDSRNAQTHVRAKPQGNQIVTASDKSLTGKMTEALHRGRPEEGSRSPPMQRVGWAWFDTTADQSQRHHTSSIV